MFASWKDNIITVYTNSERIPCEKVSPIEQALHFRVNVVKVKFSYCRNYYFGLITS